MHARTHRSSPYVAVPHTDFHFVCFVAVYQRDIFSGAFPELSEREELISPSPLLNDIVGMAAVFNGETVIVWCCLA